MDLYVTAGIERPCPRCEAGAGEACTDATGRTRTTTHQERKPQGDEE